MASSRRATLSGLGAGLLIGLACVTTTKPSTSRDAGAGGQAGEGIVATGGGPGGAPACPAVRVGEQTAALEGTWTFTPAGGAATTIQVPGGGWLAQGFRVSAARYERMLAVPSLGVAQATLIELGAVNHQAALSIDGTVVGTNTTSFTPSVFDVTAAVTPGAQHALAIDVKGRDGLRNAANRKLVPDAAGWSGNIPQGIFRSAAVRVLPLLHVSDAFVRTDVAADTVSVEVSVTNSGTADATGTVSAQLASWTCDPVTYPSLPSGSVTVPAGQTVNVRLGPVTWGLGPASYWWPNVPYVAGYRAKLHTASVTVAGAGGAVHTLPVRFGFRQIAQVGTHYELNGVRVNFRGDNLQGANYDSIKTGAGASDAYDLVPGFLPPSANNPGWPRAVDNWQRLNYNVARIHQEPASPYMLDTADEMGFMIIDETAIRGTNGDQDFGPAPTGGEPNMLAHAQALVLRDRNHPSVIRWSQCNEAELDSTNSTTFQQHLYQAIVAADDTRPVSADSAFTGAAANAPYALITATNFSVYGHYPGGLGIYTEQVPLSTTRPFGVGEFIWPADVTAQGMVWFGTATMAMRRQDASDIRPYTLLSGWASFVPGINTPMMVLEPTYPAGVINHPHFGEDNLPDPWSNPIITRIQRGMNPVLVADVAFWMANRMSNAAGDWPITIEPVAHGASLARQLVVWNDTFSGTTVDLGWEMRVDRATGAIDSQGSMQVTVPLGQHVTVPITVATPATGTLGYLILQSSKDGQAIFREDAESFTLQ